MIVRRLPIVLCALALAAGVSACGNSTSKTADIASSAGGEATGVNIADANNNGAYVQAGPITYQLQISRPLNQYITEDSMFVRGLPAGVSTSAGATNMWYGVFLWAKNQTNRPQTTSDSFEIQDSEDPPQTYHPIPVNPALNPFAWTAQTLPPGGTQPQPNSLMAQSPSQGGLVLFKVPTSVFDNRPLTLFILGSAGKKLASISLNL